MATPKINLKSKLTEQQRDLCSLIGEGLNGYSDKIFDYANPESEIAFCLLFEPLYDWLLKNVKVPQDIFEAPDHFKLPNFNRNNLVQTIKMQRTLKLEEGLIVSNVQGQVLGLAAELVLEKIAATTKPTKGNVYIIDGKNLPAHL
jgi:predicted membrane GTPase involved in stress response